MIRRACKYILFISLILATGLGFIASAEEVTADGAIARSVMKYESTSLRDPFRAYLVTEKPVPIIEQEDTSSIKPKLDLSTLKVQGIIWGVKTPQAIINGKVLSVGDWIDDVEIIKIEKKGVTLGFKGEMFVLAAPG